MNLHRPVPLWLFLAGLLLVGSVAAGLTLLPQVLAPKPDFTIDLSPSQLTLFTEPGQTSGSWISIKSLHGFVGKVSLKADAPTGVGVSLNGGGPNYDVLLGSDNALLGLNTTAFIAVSAPATGNFTIAVIGTSGSLSHAATLRLIAQDIGVDVNPQSLSLLQGSSVVTNLSLTSQNGFSGSVNLRAVSNFPIWYFQEASVKASVSSATIFLSPYTTVTMDVTVSVDDFTPPSNGTVSVIATIGNTSWVRTINVEVRKAPESLTFMSYVFNSDSNATLSIRNDGPAAVAIVYYTVTDDLGNTYSWCLGGPLQCLYPVQINATTVGALNVLVGSICYLGCSISGSQFTFQANHSYTVTMQTSRNNSFTIIIRR